MERFLPDAFATAETNGQDKNAKRAQKGSTRRTIVGVVCLDTQVIQRAHLFAPYKEIVAATRMLCREHGLRDATARASTNGMARTAAPARLDTTHPSNVATARLGTLVTPTATSCAQSALTAAATRDQSVAP